MNIVDSSAWLAYFADEGNAREFEPVLKDSASLLVPAVTLYEVFKVVFREAGEHAALLAVSAMQKGLVVDLSAQLATAAARLSLTHALPMADSIILATAQSHNATIWTQDLHFKPLPGVRYFPKK